MQVITDRWDAPEASGALYEDVEELPEMRRETVELVQQAIAENRRSYVLVNNRSEGNAPQTVQALVDQLRLPPGHPGLGVEQRETQ